MYQVTFQFENGDKPVVFSASPNITLLEAARSANVAIDAPCSGNGSCGKCRVKILSGEDLTVLALFKTEAYLIHAYTPLLLYLCLYLTTN